MTTAITMKTTISALNGLLTYCENKKMKMANIKNHVSNIGFVEFNHPTFKHAKDLANMVDNDRTYKAVAETIRFIIIAIECAIKADHAEALEMNEVVDTCVNRFKYCPDHFQAECNTKNELHGLIVNKGYELRWTNREILRMVATTWRLGMAAARAHREHTAAMLAAAPITIPDYELPF